MSNESTTREVETYTRYSAFSSEVRQIREPITHAEDTTETLAAGRMLVRVRPHYHVPDGRGSLKVVRSAFCFEAYVIRTSGEDMVMVEFVWKTDSAPWQTKGVFKPSELHRVHECECAACKGKNGIAEFEGA
ncbi:hypothetical protein OIU91_04125 [Streptomyces sp. NBC_01456]|uniref:hypothetical protein n=1 Tax=unclassified Streptomyces TaxID=2593676 RepID=UPI002E355A66|nr:MULTISPECIES: hypothetical protein [unclassified Streptomyces]